MVVEPRGLTECKLSDTDLRTHAMPGNMALLSCSLAELWYSTWCLTPGCLLIHYCVKARSQILFRGGDREIPKALMMCLPEKFESFHGNGTLWCIFIRRRTVSYRRMHIYSAFMLLSFAPGHTPVWRYRGSVRGQMTGATNRGSNDRGSLTGIPVRACLDVNQGGTNYNRYTQRLVILHYTDLPMNYPPITSQKPDRSGQLYW